MSRKTKDHARTHEENRGVICLLCLRKKDKMWDIVGPLKIEVKNAVNINLDDIRYPSAVCSSCKIIIYKFNKQNSEETTLGLPDYSGFLELPCVTRSKNKILCDCKLCEIARRAPDNLCLGNSRKRKVIKKKCKKCSRGPLDKNKICTSPKCIRPILTELISKKFSTKEKEKLASSMLKDILHVPEHSNNEGQLRLSQRRGKKLPVSVNSNNVDKSSRKETVAAIDILKISTDLGLSTRKTHSLTAALRVGSKNRKMFQPNLKQDLLLLNHQLDSFFESRVCDVLNTKKSCVINRSGCFVCCNNVQGLVTYIREKRGLQEVDLKIGLDGGGGFLKICLSIQSRFEGADNNPHFKGARQHYHDGVHANKFKDTGVKKLFILGIISDTQENYVNVCTLWSSLHLNDLKVMTIATDLKMANIITGVMAHSSHYPCTWCTASKDLLSKCGSYRTVGSCRENSDAFKNSGSKKINAKNFYSHVYQPIFTGNPETEIIDIIPPPELHLMLGVVNKLYGHMLRECEDDTEKWAKSCNVSREFVHGSPGFAGNACKTLLNKIDLLRAKCSVHCLKYVRCFNDFSSVVNSCFSSSLDEKFEVYISEFQRSYLDLAIPITPKVHAVFFHVPHFCRKMEKGLGNYSEQAMESVHHDFKNTWMNYKVHHTHPDYSSKLLRAIQEYNSRHV